MDFDMVLMEKMGYKNNTPTEPPCQVWCMMYDFATFSYSFLYTFFLYILFYYVPFSYTILHEKEK